MKIYKTLTIIGLLTLFGCSKPNIMRLIPSDEINLMTVDEIMDNQTMSNEEKLRAIRIKTTESLERHKKAVDAEKDAKLAAIIHRPVTPIRTPDTILRILMLPYEDDHGTLYSWKYSFIKVDDGRWILSNYLNRATPASKKILTPLQPE